jgi:drug/metabolite transporter (DMT)-like permease
MAAAVVQTLSGGAAMTLAAFAVGERPTASMFSMRSCLAVLYLAVLGSVVAYTAYNYVLKRMSAGKVSSYAYVNPAIAVIVGALFLGESVTLRMLASMLIILSGVAMIQIERRRETSTRRPNPL